MRLSVSNIAWDIADEGEVAAVLQVEGLRHVDLAPSRYFPDPATATASDARRVRRWWSDRGFEIAGMQSLLFGVPNLNLFADDGVMADRLAGICRLGGELGARALTFGSPRQRDRTGLVDDDARRIAVDFFRRVGDEAAKAGVLFCLEPNPVMYGCNFMVGTLEAADIVRAVAHPAVKLQLDVGAIAVNGEDASSTIAAVHDVIGHIHASEPGLVVLGDAGAPHIEAGVALRSLMPDAVVTIEMAMPTNEPHITALARAVRVARDAYLRWGAAPS